VRLGYTRTDENENCTVGAKIMKGPAMDPRKTLKQHDSLNLVLLDQRALSMFPCWCQGAV
jgi:hypothetical protein